MESLKQSVKWDAREAKRGTESTTGFQRGAAGARINGVHWMCRGARGGYWTPGNAPRDAESTKGTRGCRGLKGSRGHMGATRWVAGADRFGTVGTGRVWTQVDARGTRGYRRRIAGAQEVGGRWYRGCKRRVKRASQELWGAGRHTRGHWVTGGTGVWGYPKLLVQHKLHEDLLLRPANLISTVVLPMWIKLWTNSPKQPPSK